MRPNILNRRAALLACLLVGWLTWPAPQSAIHRELAASELSSSEAGLAVDLVMVPEEDARLLPLAVPLVGRLSASGQSPTLLVASSAASSDTALFLRQLDPRRCLVLKTPGVDNPLGSPKHVTVDVVELGHSLTQAGLEIAKRFWDKTEKVVFAQPREPSAMILASAVAAHVKAPFVPVERNADAQMIKARLGELKVKHVLVVADRAAGAPMWLRQLPQQIETLDTRQAAERLVRTIGPQQIRNVIVARAPNAAPAEPDAPLLASYLSLVRKAPTVLVESADGRRVEADVLAFLRAHSLKPHTITIIGDYQDISSIALSDRKTLGEYTVEIEPCSGPIGGGAAAYGVGRIPQTSLRDASLLIARGIARERIVARHRPQVLMIANPSAEYGPLPFAETVSRVTAQEFKNLGVAIDEFYGKPANTPAVVKAAGKALLIIFEGHVTDQLLFQDPTPPEPLPEEEVPVVTDDDGTVIINPVWQGEPAQAAISAINASASIAIASGPAAGGAILAEAGKQPDARDEGGQVQVQPDEPGHPQTSPPDLGGLPLVVLQSCHSLDLIVAEQAFKHGGAGVLGSVTNVHSASGSAFAKAYCDGLLYRGQTAGEALRDARNYFLCLARLKAQRGHKEQAKVYRVAMSFRLWGDPEVAVLPNAPARVRLAPVSARFVAVDRVQITTPARFLPECRTNRYIARMFPGSQAAGVVKRLKGKEHRRLMPTYFFVLPTPEGFADGKYTKLQGEGDAGQRAVFLTHPAGHSVCLLYFPEKDKRRGEITLQFLK